MRANGRNWNTPIPALRRRQACSLYPATRLSLGQRLAADRSWADAFSSLMDHGQGTEGFGGVVEKCAHGRHFLCGRHHQLGDPAYTQYSAKSCDDWRPAGLSLVPISGSHATEPAAGKSPPKERQADRSTSSLLHLRTSEVGTQFPSEGCSASVSRLSDSCRADDTSAGKLRPTGVVSKAMAGPGVVGDQRPTRPWARCRPKQAYAICWVYLPREKSRLGAAGRRVLSSSSRRRQTQGPARRQSDA